MVKLTVITREVSPAISKCQLTHISRNTIDYGKMVEQHDGYVAVFERVLKEGYDIEMIRLPALEAFPDCMFTEDVGMIYDGCAVVSRPGAPSRTDEVKYIRRYMDFLRPGNVHNIAAPGNVDGGDVFPVGKYIFVGQSTRTNDDAFDQLKKITSQYSFIDEVGKRHPYECVRLPVKGRLHIKTAGSFLDDRTVMMDTAACDRTIFTTRGITVLDAPKGEEAASNPLSFIVTKKDSPESKRVVVINAGWPKTSALIRAWADEEMAADRLTEVVEISADEIAKAEGSLTCLSLLCYHKEAIIE